MHMVKKTEILGNVLITSVLLLLLCVLSTLYNAISAVTDKNAYLPWGKNSHFLQVRLILVLEAQIMCNNEQSNCVIMNMYSWTELDVSSAHPAGFNSECSSGKHVSLKYENCCLSFNQTKQLVSNVGKLHIPERTRIVLWILLSKREKGKYQQLFY